MTDHYTKCMRCGHHQPVDFKATFGSPQICRACGQPITRYGRFMVWVALAAVIVALATGDRIFVVMGAVLVFLSGLDYLGARRKTRRRE